MRPVREFGNWNPIFEMSQMWPISVIKVQKKVLEVTIIEINLHFNRNNELKNKYILKRN